MSPWTRPSSNRPLHMPTRGSVDSGGTQSSGRTSSSRYQGDVGQARGQIPGGGRLLCRSAEVEALVVSSTEAAEGGTTPDAQTMNRTTRWCSRQSTAGGLFPVPATIHKYSPIYSPSSTWTSARRCPVKVSEHSG